MSNLSKTPTFDFARTAAATPRITYKPTFVPGAVDPDLVRPSKTVAPGNLVLTLGSIALGVLAIGDRFYQLSAQYNDVVVNAILWAMPVALLLGAIAGFRIVSAWRRNERELKAGKATQNAKATAATEEADDDVRFLPQHGPVAPRFRRQMATAA